MTPREECLALIRSFTFKKPDRSWASKIMERKRKGFSLPEIAVRYAEEVQGYHPDETEL